MMTSLSSTSDQERMAPVSINENSRMLTPIQREQIPVATPEPLPYNGGNIPEVPKIENIARNGYAPGHGIDRHEGHVQENLHPPDFKYVFDLLTNENAPGNTQDTVYRSVDEGMDKYQIKSDLVLWLIGSEENLMLHNPYGRRLVKEILALISDSGSLLVCQGTNKFFACIRSLFVNPKLMSVKQNFKVLFCKNATDSYTTLLQRPMHSNEGRVKFQCAFIFENGTVNYTELVEKIPTDVMVILVKSKFEIRNEQYNGNRCVLNLEASYSETDFSIGKFILTEFMKKITPDDVIQHQNMVLLAIYLNQIELAPIIQYKDFTEPESTAEDLVWLRKISSVSVRLYRQNCLTHMCQQGLDFIKYLMESNVREHLQTVSWLQKSILMEDTFSLHIVHLEMQTLIERIVGKHYFHKKEIEFTLEEVLFFDAILEKKLEASILYWTLVRHPLPAALVAYGLFKDMKRKEKGDRTALKENINTYKKLSIEAVNNSYFKSSSETLSLLMEAVEEWGNASCVQIALATDNKEFLSEQPLIDLQKRIWCAQPLEDRPINPDIPIKEKLRWFGKEVMSPRVLFYINFLLYFAFHIMYGIQLLYFLKASSFEILEYLPPFYVLTLTLQLTQQLCPWNRHALDVYFGIDVCCVTLFYVALCLRVAGLLNQGNGALMNAARVFYSLDYIAFSLRLFKFFYANKYLGPITATLYVMFWTLLRFLAIVGVFLLGCMVATESVMYPESQFNVTQLFTLFRKPYWSMFGEFFLDEIEATDDTCINNLNGERCLSNVGQYYGPIILATFVLVVNLLVFSLIVAKFNSNIIAMEEKSVEIWRHQMFKLTMEYYRIIFLQPPLLILSLCFGVCRYRERKETRDISRAANLQKFEQDVVMYLKQQIDDGRFFKRLKEYKRVGKVDVNVVLGNFQSTSEELSKNFSKEMGQMESLKKLQNESKEDLLKINAKIEYLQKFIHDVPSQLDNLLKAPKNETPTSNLSKDNVKEMLQQSEKTTAESIGAMMSDFKQSLSKISETTTRILNKERYFDGVK